MKVIHNVKAVDDVIHVDQRGANFEGGYLYAVAINSDGDAVAGGSVSVAPSPFETHDIWGTAKDITASDVAPVSLDEGLTERLKVTAISIPASATAIEIHVHRVTSGN
ncbi:hypothetical protein VPHK469_0107 [Vibrio phage K469]